MTGPRSNPATYVKLFDEIRKLYSETPDARTKGFTPGRFSFNVAGGRCEACSGDGIVKIEMHFLPDVYVTCDVCKGTRYNRETLEVRFKGKSIADVLDMTINMAVEFFENVPVILNKIKVLQDVGLGYLKLGQPSTTISGGESQRIRLATQIGSRLVNVLYILDEPSIGLHQRDNDKLLATLKRLRDLGNTLLVVEHDEDTMRAADYLIDIGPGAGVHGGEVVAAGTPEEVAANPKSLTGMYLSRKRRIPVPAARRTGNGKVLRVLGAEENNLKHIDVSIPLGTFTCVTGVSGSGKSSLVNSIIYKRLGADLNRMKLRAGRHEGMEGEEYLDKIIAIDQSPIGRTPRSNPATYTGLFGEIRDLFSETQEAKARGYGPGRFSFNVRGGRCEACGGDGLIKIEMHFLPDIYVPCETCGGKRYNRETLEVHYKGRNISEVLEMTAEEARDFFASVPHIARKVQTLCDVGLGYVKLGQSSTTLSGGEAQRVKLATELMADARALLARGAQEERLHAKAVFGIWPAHSAGDDIVVEGGTVLHSMRQQKQSDKPRYALADFVAPQGQGGYVGALQLSVTGGDAWAEEFAAANDTYNSLLIGAACSMLAEALAECTNDIVNELWHAEGSTCIRPACGYPSQPDHAEKRIVFDLLNATERTGATLTESYMMKPTSSVCALLFNHPNARYITVGPIGEDQRSDYAARCAKH